MEPAPKANPSTFVTAEAEPTCRRRTPHPRNPLVRKRSNTSRETCCTTIPTINATHPGLTVEAALPGAGHDQNRDARDASHTNGSRERHQASMVSQPHLPHSTGRPFKRRHMASPQAHSPFEVRLGGKVGSAESINSTPPGIRSDGRLGGFVSWRSGRFTWPRQRTQINAPHWWPIARCSSAG
jgi:hypothetical protein